MNKIEVAEIVKLFKHLPNSPVVDKESLDETVNLFFLILEDLPREMVRASAVQYLSENNPFFPTPGIIRDKAMELQLLAAGIPTAAEAWGMVLGAQQYTEPRFCEQGWKLREAVGEKVGKDYWDALKASSDHDKNCSVCDSGGFREQYRHPAVKETVRLLGGRDVLMTDNPAADRARFIEAYREVVTRERMKMAMSPRVAQFVEDSRPLLMDDRRSAFETDEGRQIQEQYQRLALDMGRNERAK